MRLLDVYNAMIIVGIVMPLLSVTLSAFDFDLDLDLDIDVPGGTDIEMSGGIPVNLTCLFFGILVFGVAGRASYGTSSLLSIVSGVVFGILGYWISFRYILIPLKKRQIKTLSVDDIIGKPAKVTSAIYPDKVGEVSLQDGIGSNITYLAKYDYSINEDREIIPVDTDVIILDLNNSEVLVTRFIT